MRCHKWDCPNCGPQNRKRVLRSLEGTRVDTLITLTCSRSHYRSPDAAFYVLSASIPILMKRLRRAFPRTPIEYFCVWESTRTGWPHVHVLFRGPFIPQRTLSRHWADLTCSPIVDIRHVNSQAQVASYLSKYLVKQPRVPFGHRRFRTSRAFWQAGSPSRRNPCPSGEPWKLRRDSLYTLADIWVRLGFVISFDHPSSFTARYVQPPPVFFPHFPHDLQTPLRTW